MDAGDRLPGAGSIAQWRDQHPGLSQGGLVRLQHSVGLVQRAEHGESGPALGPRRGGNRHRGVGLRPGRGSRGHLPGDDDRGAERRVGGIPWDVAERDLPVPEATGTRRPPIGIPQATPRSQETPPAAAKWGKEQTCRNGQTAQQADSQTGKESKVVHNISSTQGWLLHTLEGHTDALGAVGYSADGQLLATTSCDGTARLWRCDTWSSLGVIREAADRFRPTSLSFHPKLPLIASACLTAGMSYEGRRLIQVWELDLAVLLGQTTESVHH